MAQDHTLTVGSTVASFSGYSNKQIGTGTVTRVLLRWVLVEGPQWAIPVKFRTCAPLKGHRITGGLAEHLNEWIKVPAAVEPDPTAGAEGPAQPAPKLLASPARPQSHTSCHTLRRVLVRRSTMNLTTGAMTPTGQEWTTRACDVPLFSDLERASGVCTSCASGWTHPENSPLVPVFDAAAHARFSLRHWQAMQDQAATAADLARAAEGVATWSARLADLARLRAPIASEAGSTPAA